MSDQIELYQARVKSSADALAERAKTLTETKATEDDPNKVSCAERAMGRDKMSYSGWCQLVNYVSQ